MLCSKVGSLYLLNIAAELKAGAEIKGDKSIVFVIALLPEELQKWDFPLPESLGKVPSGNAIKSHASEKTMISFLLFL